jgi:molecular chaperone Hsp33
VPLEGETLTACVRDYFQTSEQIDTGFVSHVEKDKRVNGGGGLDAAEIWRARAGTTDAARRRGRRLAARPALMHSVKREEMLQAELPLNTLLYRLFHEEQVRVFPPIEIKRGCRCNMDKIRGIIGNLSP